jgi:hypothetical protein
MDGTKAFLTDVSINLRSNFHPISV